MEIKLEKKYLSQVFIVRQSVYQNTSVCIMDVCVGLMCELRSTEQVINSFNKYLFLGKNIAQLVRETNIYTKDEITDNIWSC